ncbi:MAG TPA: Ig-like domain-containing protein [Steroidobacteraceae bacterium]
MLWSGCLAAVLTGCAGNGEGLDANGQPIGSDGAMQPLTADFQSIQDNVFTPICTKCHIGAGAPEGLQLDASHSYALLVGVPSAEQPAVLRVDPGHPDSSYLVLKLQGSAGISGVRMPFGGPYLPQSTIDVIRQWVGDGAQPASAASVSAAVRSVRHFGVAATAPDDGAIVPVPVSRIIVAFTAELDPALISAATIVLERTAVPEQAALPVVISMPRGNPSALIITPRQALSSGTWRVSLHGTLADMSAESLGTDYSFTFTVDPSP